MPHNYPSDISHAKFNIIKPLLDYTRTTLTTRAMAKYILTKVGYTNGKILYLSGDLGPDYLRCLTLIGLKELLDDQIIDFPKIEHIYTTYSKDIRNLYGKGISYTKIIQDITINRSNIKKRILNKEFALIIYGSVHRGRPFHNLVNNTYPKEKILYLCGEDSHGQCEYFYWTNLFLREFN